MVDSSVTAHTLTTVAFTPHSVCVSQHQLLQTF